MNKFLDYVLGSPAIAQKHIWVKLVILIVLLDLILDPPVVPMVPGNLILLAKETLERPKMDVMDVLDPMVDLEIGLLKLFWALNQLTQLDPKTTKIERLGPVLQEMLLLGPPKSLHPGPHPGPHLDPHLLGLLLGQILSPIWSLLD
jgi:hypothetical protein